MIGIIDAIMGAIHGKARVPVEPRTAIITQYVSYPMPFVWTKTRPTKPGWYWVRAKNLTPRIVKMYDHTLTGRMDCEYDFGASNGWLDGHFPLEFAGPIPRPQ